MNQGPNNTVERRVEDLIYKTVKDIDKEYYMIDPKIFFQMREDISYMAGKLEGIKEIMNFLKELEQKRDPKNR